MSRPSRLKRLRSKYSPLEVRCDNCKRFIGPGPSGWCELEDDTQIPDGLCFEFEPPEEEPPG